MKHPRNREERRAVRDGWITRRKYIAEVIWNDPYFNQTPHEGHPWYMHQPGWYKPMAWGKYAKFNLGCGDSLCHGAKYFSCKEKRRRALKAAGSQAEFRKRDKVAGS